MPGTLVVTLAIVGALTLAVLGVAIFGKIGRHFWALQGLLALAVMATCVVSAGTIGTTTVRGAVNQLDKSAEQAATDQVVACRSGQSMHFVGVDLRMRSDRSLRLVQDPVQNDWAINIDQGRIIMRKPNCSAWNIRYDRKNHGVNSGKITYWNIDGSIHVKCLTEGGAEVVADIEFENCH